METSMSAHQGLQLNSLAFALFVIGALFFYRLTLGEKIKSSSSGQSLRRALLFVFNLAFLYFFISGLQSLIVLTALLLTTFGLGRWRAKLAKQKRDLPRFFTFVSITFWGLLFLVKDPGLVSVINPFVYFPLKLVGVSFLFFRCINYVEDSPILDKHSIVDFLNFMIFFPTLIAGPLERFDRYLSDFQKPHDVDSGVALAACHRIATGVIKKFVLADSLYPLTGFGGADPIAMAMPALWVMFALQLFVLFLDFSGYVDIMLGIGRLMGFKLAENFNKPFKARDIAQFWERWHMSLTSFIQDYMFSPLMRQIMMKAPRNLQFTFIVMAYFFTMMVIALWHGTDWGFFMFGILHGIALVYLQIRKKYLKPWKGTIFHPLTWESPALVGQVFTYLYVSLTMLLWAYGPSTALQVMGKMVGF